MKYLLTLFSVISHSCVLLGAEPTYTLDIKTGVVSPSRVADTTPALLPAPTSKVVIPQGYHAHETVNGTIVHHDSNLGNPAAHAGVLGKGWPKTGFPGQVVTVQNCPNGVCPAPARLGVKATAAACPCVPAPGGAGTCGKYTCPANGGFGPCPCSTAYVLPLPMTPANTAAAASFEFFTAKAAPVRGLLKRVRDFRLKRPRLFFNLDY